ncbi:hypothetical protein [Fulvimarina pelagi]|uniref:hypothetical protein n=1 Tax=Fulvimarina pelagi TaxID=217511 RepID=UPI0016515678|nr:hypothetical protein [Fulvimarina pelagi]
MRAKDDSAFDDAMNPPPRERKFGKAEDKRAARKRGKDYSESEIDEALDETFPASDPIAPSRIDGPRN